MYIKVPLKLMYVFAKIDNKVPSCSSSSDRCAGVNGKSIKSCIYLTTLRKTAVSHFQQYKDFLCLMVILQDSHTLIVILRVNRLIIFKEISLIRM